MVSSHFLCYDILSKVFEHLEPGCIPPFDQYPAIISERKLRQYTLAVSARVCSAFAAPALDVLWRHAHHFVYLLRLFSTYSDTEECFVGAIGDKDWQRFQQYASRIRSINANFSQSIGAPHQEQVWMVLLQRSQGSPLLPRLEDLTIDVSLGGLISLLAPSVDSLNVGLPIPSGNGRAGTLLADTVRPHLSHVKTLELNEYVTPGPGPRRSIAMPKCIDFCALTHLESLDVVHPVIARRSMIQALLTFPNLRSLSLVFELSWDERHFLEASAFPPGFFELRELDLTASYDDLALFLEVTNPPRLDTLALARNLEWGDHPMFEDLLRAYAKIPPQLSDLRLRYRVFPENSNVPGDRYIEPLLTLYRVLPPSIHALHNLREVYLRFTNVTCTLENDDLAILCGAWPALEDFEFDGLLYCNDDATRLPTLNILLAFTRAHPRLRRLTLPGLNPKEIPDRIDLFNAGALRDWPAHGLRLFRLRTYMVGTPLVSLAYAVDRAFPSLDLGPVRAAKISGNGDPADLLLAPLLAFQMSRTLGTIV